MADLTDKTFVVTGASSGVGKHTAKELARQGAHVVLAGRSREKTEAAIAEITREVATTRLAYVPLDLGDLASVRACATALLAGDRPIHGLINNAGLAGQRGQTRDGFEIQFGTNHLGPYLLTRLLLDRMVESGPARIVNVSSRSHYLAKAIDWDALQRPTRTFTAMHEYGVSKLANVLFAKELARRLDPAKVTTYAVHPGVVATEIWRRIPQPVRWAIKRRMITPEQGAQASLRCATDPALDAHTGRYYDVGGVEKQPSRLAEDVELARTLWRKSAEWTGLPA